MKPQNNKLILAVAISCLLAGCGRDTEAGKSTSNSDVVDRKIVENIDTTSVSQSTTDDSLTVDSSGSIQLTSQQQEMVKKLQSLFSQELKDKLAICKRDFKSVFQQQQPQAQESLSQLSRRDRIKAIMQMLRANSDKIPQTCKGLRADAKAEISKKFQTK